MAENSYKIQLSGGLVNGEDIVRSLPETIAKAGGYDFEEYWHTLEIPAFVTADANAKTLDIDDLDNPRMLIILGGEGVCAVLGGTGTDEVQCNPMHVSSNETDGISTTTLPLDTIELRNKSSREQRATVIVFSYKT